MKIYNGRRVPVAFGEGRARYEGIGGISDRPGPIREVAYANDAIPRIGGVGTVEGRPYRVISATDSDFNPGVFVILKVEALDE